MATKPLVTLVKASEITAGDGSEIIVTISIPRRAATEFCGSMAEMVGERLVRVVNSFDETRAILVELGSLSHADGRSAGERFATMKKLQDRAKALTWLTD